MYFLIWVIDRVFKMAEDKGLSLYNNLDRAVSDNDAELRRIYRDWADNYDRDNDQELGTVSQPTMVHLFEKFCELKSAKILDIGCGTGLVGEYLSNAGYVDFDGADISQDMLSHANGRGYQNLFTANLSETLPIADDSYDACLCVGVFTHGHVGPSGFDELIRITKPRGLIGFTINEDVYTEYGYDVAIDKLTSDRRWQPKLHQTADYMTKKDVKGIYVIAEVS